MFKRLLGWEIYVGLNMYTGEVGLMPKIVKLGEGVEIRLKSYVVCITRTKQRESLLNGANLFNADELKALNDIIRTDS